MSIQDKTSDAGGVAWTAGNTKFIDEQFRKDLNGYNAYERGLEVGRTTQPHSAAPITDEPERALMGMCESARASLAGRAQKVFLDAQGTIRRRPGKLNAAALFAKAITEWAALRTATLEKAKPVVQHYNEALGVRNHFEGVHRRGRLGEFDYSEDCSIWKPLAIALIVAFIDALLNATQFVPVMPGGAPQALIISAAMSVSMAIAGIFAGSAIRYWRYNERYRRFVWRLVGLVATLIALAGAGVFAQYRAVLEAVARDGGEPSLAAITTTVPTMMSVTVLIGAVAVFLISAMKFMGGRGSPWATYGDHARYDREVRKTARRLEELKRFYFDQVRQIAADILEQFEEIDHSDRAMVQQAYDSGDRARLQISDLQKSEEKYFTLTVREIQRFRDGVMAVRSELVPEQFREEPQYTASEFPDPAQLDKALSETEATFAARTDQLAQLETEVGALELKALEEFPALIVEMMNAGEKQRIRDRQMKRIVLSPEEAAT